MHVVTEVVELKQSSAIVAQGFGCNCMSNEESFAGDDVRVKVSTLFHASYSERCEP